MGENLKRTDLESAIQRTRESFDTDNPTVPYIEGDGIGVDIWPAAQGVFDAVVEKAYKGQRKINWLEVLAGQKAFDNVNEWLPEETTNKFEEYGVGIKGPLTTPVGEGIRSINVSIRQIMDLYVCLRPIKYFNGIQTPTKNPQDVDITLFRENTEDVYAGKELEEGSEEVQKLNKFLKSEFGWEIREDSGIGIKPISKTATERLVRASLNYAVENNKKNLALVHKGNIMKFTEGYFKKWTYGHAEEQYGDKVFTWAQYDRIQEEKGTEAANTAQKKAILDGKIIIKDVIADAFLQQILLRPNEYDVIATMNLNGDYISDALAAMVGGIGIAPGANISDEYAVFEATHGTAPKYAGQNRVNPGSLILSAEMMLRYMGWTEASDLIISSMDRAISAKKVTYDFARMMNDAELVSSSGFADEMIKRM